MERRDVARGELAERGRRGGRDGVEDAEQRVAVAVLVAGDELRVVEVVAGVHADAARQAPAHRDLLAGVEERDLDAVDLRGVGLDDAKRRVHRAHGVGVAPVARERGIEHVAQPVQDHGLARLREDAVVHALVVRGRPRHTRERAACHDDHAPAERLDRLHLVLVSGDHVVDGARALRREVIRADAARDERARHVARGVERAADELERRRPVEAHAPLRGVHRLGHAEPERPEVAAIGEGGVPVDGGGEPRIDGGEGIGHDVRGGVGDAREGARGVPSKRARLAQRIRLGDAADDRQANDERGAIGRVHAGSSGTSIQRRSFQLFCAHSTSCTPLAPSRSVHLNGASSITWRMKSSHCTLKPLS